MSNTTNYLDSLVEKVDDPTLREALVAGIQGLRDNKQFGLVYEQHLPETVRLYTHPVRRGVTVQSKTGGDTTWIVKKVAKGTATLVTSDGRESEAPTADLVVVREFGTPIYPGLKSVGRIERGGDKPFHTVINSENYHALETLLYAYEGKVDCIYVDPPYNTGARDWKYNNNYVDGNDAYRHSKWLSFMEKRLTIARRLLNPYDSALIVTIDEKEYLRLGLLLQQVFPDATMQMVSSLINPKGTGRANELRRVDEYVYLLWFGEATLGRVATLSGISDGVDSEGTASDESRPGLDWQTARRRDLASVRRTRPSQFYPIYVNTSTGRIEHVGDPIGHDVDRGSVDQLDGCVAVFPIRPDGTEMNWGVTRPTFVDRWQKGYARAGRARPNEPQPYIIQYLKSGSIRDIEQGLVTVTGRNADGSVIGHYGEEKAKAPTTQWALKSHNAEHYGTGVLKSLLPRRSFPFPKSLYAVEDVLSIFLLGKPEALVVDFFGGSGTTTHAVMRLNHRDDGSRRSVLITNNEVGPDTERALSDRGVRPGDQEWESLGIFEHITMPRIVAAVAGETPEGQPVEGDYKFIDEFPMRDGFEENVEFLALTYEDRDSISLGRAFGAVAPLLWMKAGSQGPMIDKIPRDKDWAAPEGGNYAILFDTEQWGPFVAEISGRSEIGHVFVVTNSTSEFQQVITELPTNVEATMLYEDYLSTFEINTAQDGGAA